MKNVRVLFKITKRSNSFREVVKVNDTSDDKELRQRLNDLIKGYGYEKGVHVSEILLVEVL